MQIHQLKPIHKNKKKKRVGRGGKRGNYSGRGIKGQKSRAGRRIKPQERELIKKLPKLKGYKNKPIKPKPIVINLDDLAKVESDVIDRKSLIKAGMIRKNDKRVKILGQGEINKKIIIKGIEISKSAQEKIEKSGGQVILD